MRKSYFFSSLLGQGSGQFPKLSPLENYAAGIIHELLHVTGDFPYETGDIAHVAAQSIFYTADVVEACFPAAIQ